MERIDRLKQDWAAIQECRTIPFDLVDRLKEYYDRAIGAIEGDWDEGDD